MTGAGAMDQSHGGSWGWTMEVFSEESINQDATIFTQYALVGVPYSRGQM